MLTKQVFHRYKGIFLILTATFLWGIGGTLAKYLFLAGIEPTDLVQARLTYSFLLLGLILACFNKTAFLIDLKDIGYFLVLGVFGLAILQFTYFYAINKIDVGIAVTIQYTAPSMILVYQLLFLKKKATFITFLAIGLALVGCYFVVGVNQSAIEGLNWEGLIAAIISAITFAFYTIYSKKGLAKYGAWTVFFYVLLIASIFWNIIHPPLALVGKGYSYNTWGLIFSIALISTLIPFGLFYVGLESLEPVVATVTSTMEPIFAIVIAFLVLGEKLDWLQIIGGLLIIVSVVVMALFDKKDNQADTSKQFL